MKTGVSLGPVACLLLAGALQAGATAPDQVGKLGPGIDISKVAEEVNPAVVNIEVPGDQTGVQQGSGFVTDAKGEIITNFHVISEAMRLSRPIFVSLPDGRVVPASVKGFDEATDIALLEVEVKGEPLPTVRLGDSDRLRIGEWVIAIGSPWGLDHTVTLGIISAKRRQLPGGFLSDFLQTDAAINPGNSGGPLVNVRGEVVGISTFAATVGAGLAFAIPVNTLKDVLPQLREKGRVTRGAFAVQVVDTTPYIRRRLGLEKEEGVLVTGVRIGSSAARARIRREDIILKVNGVSVSSASEFNRMVASQAVGGEIELTIYRERREYTVRAVIQSEQELAGT